MTDAFRVPGSWDIPIQDSSTISSSSSSYKYSSSNSSKSSIEIGDQLIDKFDTVSDFRKLDSESIISQDSVPYRKFITRAGTGNRKPPPTHTTSDKASIRSNMAKKSANNSKKVQKPILVKFLSSNMGNDTEEYYQFPYELCNSWSNFQSTLADAYPKYKYPIENNDVLIINEEQKCMFLPEHYESYIKPGIRVSVKLKKTARLKEPKAKQVREVKHSKSTVGSFHIFKKDLSWFAQ